LHEWTRRQLTSQQAMILAEQLATDPEFAEQCELLEQEARERQEGGWGRGWPGEEENF
jgi:hypothetical protein